MATKKRGSGGQVGVSHPLSRGRGHQRGEARARETGGFGLGLALAKAAVESQGGELTAANNPETGGLVAVIRLPGWGEE